ncbi:MAG: death-on-curing protein [Verrucomicrobiales bacterium]|jgi:death-on-curing protein
MEDPDFLSVDNVLYLHANTINMEGGANGIRELALLESAALTPQQQFGGGYLHSDLPAMAAAYLFHLCSNHPFVDGNKRVGAMAAYVFLDVNGWSLSVGEAAFEKTVMSVAAGECSKEELTIWIREQTSSIIDS